MTHCCATLGIVIPFPEPENHPDLVQINQTFLNLEVQNWVNANIPQYSSLFPSPLGPFLAICNQPMHVKISHPEKIVKTVPIG